MTDKQTLIGAFLVGIGLPGTLEFLLSIGMKTVAGITAASLGVMTVIGAVAPVEIAAGTGSMQPTIDGGDRLVHEYGVTGVEEGDIIIFTPPESNTSYGHKAVFWVDEGENWYDKADKDHVVNASSCSELRNCPAPHSGWITKGTANPEYDQAAGRAGVVKPGWVEGKVIAIVDDGNITWV